jgi:Zn-dependent protease
MRGIRGWKLATLFGVDIKIHFSLVFLLFYVILIASAQFPLVVEQSEIDPSSVYGHPLFWGILFAFSLFLSVILHEFGHVFVAKSMGVKVQGITLMMLGGVSEMDRIPQKKYAEFKVSIIGPIVSFGIAGLLLAIKGATNYGSLSFFCYWLARVNIVLGVFNLFPAFPLDGGRAFRSLLSVRYGPVRATRAAVKLAKIAAWFLGIWGLLAFNLILVLIAVFIYSSANSELVLLLNKGRLKGLRAGEVGIKTPVVDEGDTLEKAAKVMRSSRNASLPVRTASKTPAIVSLSAFRQIDSELWATTRVKEVMDPVIRVLDVNDSIAQSLSELASEGALPLAEDDRLIGIVRYRDVDEILALRDADQ